MSSTPVERRDPEAVVRGLEDRVYGLALRAPWHPEVQSSAYAKLGGVPVAVLGLGGYLAILAAALAPGELARLATAGLALVGAAFSAYLTYLELFVIDAICQWCVASAVLMALLAVLAVWRVLAAPVEAPAPRRRRPGAAASSGGTDPTRAVPEDARVG